MRRRLVLWLATGCGVCMLSTAAAGASLDANTGRWLPRRVPSAQLVISAPDSWVDFSRTTPQLLEKMRSNPSTRSFAELAQRSQAIKLLLVDVDPQRLAAGFATNLSVIQFDVPTGVDLRLAADAAIAQLRATNAPIKVVARSSLRLPAGHALRLRYRERSSKGEVSATQYYLLHRHTVTVLTYSTLTKYAPLDRSTFTRSARSLRFL